jgi:hypothetical protein
LIYSPLLNSTSPVDPHHNLYPALVQVIFLSPICL